jgi:hypothetical protein
MDSSQCQEGVMRIALVSLAALAVLATGGCTDLPKQLPFMGKPNNFAKMPDRPLPKPRVSIKRRVATVRLPYRNREGRSWVVATPTGETQPFTLRKLDVRPGKGPRGTDLAVYTYAAEAAGSTTLRFELMDFGAGAPTPPARIAQYETTVSAR